MVMVQSVHFLEHLLQSVLHAVRGSFLSLFGVGGVIAVIVESVNYFITHNFGTTPTFHIFAIALGLVAGYGVALTYAVIQLIRGAIRIVKVLEDDIAQEEHLVGGAIQQLEHLVIGR
jgi:hypothetical protein